MKFRNFLVLALMIFTTPDYALSISINPGDELYNGTQQTGWNTNSQSDIDAILSGLGITNELYKATPGSIDEGALKYSYSTVYDNNTDASGATITYNSGSFANDVYLLVKDGNHTPWWYVFDLGTNGLNWNGMDDLVLSNFWPSNGSISHVTLYGTPGTNPVPEPATMMLFGLGLLGLAGVGRRKK